jgi:hypothetical protein
VTDGSLREFGWFMCGEVNGKNRMGGYVGFRPFFVYFSPTAPDTVQDGAIEDSELKLVAGWCRGLYGSTL